MQKGFQQSKSLAEDIGPVQMRSYDAEAETILDRPAPKIEASEKALDNLEQFAGKCIPTTRVAFLDSEPMER